MAKLMTSHAATIADCSERWYYDLASHTVRDENGLTVVAVNPTHSNTEGTIIAAAPHSLSLVLRLSQLLGSVSSGEAGPRWKERAKELIAEAHDLIADPGSVEEH